MDSNRSTRVHKLLRPRYLAVAGALLFFAAIVAFLGIITAEALYPEGYTTSGNEISDLGATQPPNSVVEQPSAAIFNICMMVYGVFVLGASFCVQRGFRRVAAPVLMALFGIGVLGIGIFPGNYGDIHPWFALAGFAGGGTAAIVSSTIATGPFRYFSVVLGVVSLVVLVLELFLRDSNPVRELGIGGVERWVVYPIMLWVAGLGGHLMGRAR